MTPASTRAPDVAALAPYLGVPARLRLLDLLMAGEALPVTELARRIGVAVPTASEHLSRLRDGGLVVQIADGRRRLYRLASPQVAAAMEALAHLADSRPVRSLREAQARRAAALARTCYDHLAGRLGVALHDRLVVGGALEVRPGGYALTPGGVTLLESLGVDTAAARLVRRSFARPCLDVTERRPHLAGALGAVLCAELMTAGWLVRRTPGERALLVTPIGRRGLGDRLGITLSDLPPESGG